MSRLVLLLEELSMKVLLEGLLRRLFPDLPFQCVPHEGKRDLEKSIPRKLRAWREPGVRFLVLLDNDGGDCRALKKRLALLCADAGRPDVSVRIACQELEAWYLGDPDALAACFGNEALRRIRTRARFRDPDTVDRPSAAVQRLVPEFQKVSGARRMAMVLTSHGNNSRSFHALLERISQEFAALPARPDHGDNP